jgi:multicomponent Na+:H+ antiporter subunit F
MILQIILVMLLLSMALAVIRAVRGPNVFERILAANVFGTKTLLLIVVVGFLKGAPEDYVDIALMYAIIAFIGTVAVLRCVEYGGFLDRPEDDSK